MPLLAVCCPRTPCVPVLPIADEAGRRDENTEYPLLINLCHVLGRTVQVVLRIEARTLVPLVLIQTCWRWLIALVMSPVFGMESPMARIPYARAAMHLMAVLPTTFLASLSSPPLPLRKPVLT